MVIVLRSPKRQMRMALVLVALGVGVVAQNTSSAAPAPAAEPLRGALAPQHISVSAGFGQGSQTPARHPEEELLVAPAPIPQLPPGVPGQADQGEQADGQQGEQEEGAQAEPAPAPPPAAAVEQELLTPAEREAMALVEQMIRDQEGVLMGTGFSYDRGGRRDPFVDLLAAVSAVGAPTVRPFGLPGFLIGEVELNAIASAQGRWHAMVVGPDQRAYFLVVGAQLFDGHVMDIRPGEVVFEQVVPDLSGARRTRQVTKRLRTTDGGGETP